MDVNTPLLTVLVASYCLLWTASYVLFVVKGFKDKTYCVPLVATCMNISWEFLFSFIYPDTGNMYRTWLYRFWFLPDALVVYQMFRYGRAAQLIPEVKRHFVTVTVFALACCLAGVYLFANYYSDKTGTEYAYIQNLVMSITFIFFYFNRRDLKGISIPAAWTKMLGTGLASVVVYFYYPYFKDPRPFNFMTLLFVLIFVFDVTYIVLITRRKRELAGKRA